MPRLRQLQTALLSLSTILAATSPPAPGGTEEPLVRVHRLGDSGPIEIVDDGQLVLRYNYQTVAEPPELKGLISADNRKYAVARSDYIHPLYGPRGEVLTEDWSPDHPHHRGIYWAWPEVDWQGQRGDLHALQNVFARPTGKLDIEEGADFARITAENQWCWADGTPIVRELATICARHKTGPARSIDLEIRFTAIDTDVMVARRDQTHYGGLNLRLAAADRQEIKVFTDPSTASPRAAWAHRSGVPRGGRDLVGLTILQSPRNPEDPGDWIQYPELSWVQPTFPASGTRYRITRNRPLELRYRLWIHEGKPEFEAIRGLWSSYSSSP